MRAIWVLMAAGVASTMPAHANADGDLLRKLDVLGTWAFDCSREPAPDNAVLTYQAGDGEAPTERLTMGEVDRVSPLTDVVLLADGKIRWVQRTESGTLTIVNLVESGRLKTWSSKSAAGEVFIADGKFAAGDDAPWFNRCDSRR